MLIELHKLKYFFLTHNNIKRKNHILNVFKEVDLTEVNPTNYESRNKSGASGFLKMLELGEKNQDPNKVFKPFILLEDDIEKYREFPESLEIPNNTDILYIGLTRCGIMIDNWSFNVYYSNINNNIIKVENMLALHGLIICSQTGLNIFKTSLIKDFELDQPWDISIAKAQPFYNIFALRKPLVFQKAELGGQEELTKIEYEDYEHCNPNKST